MAIGLRIWDAAGNLAMDINDQVSQGLGTATIDAGSSGSVSVPVTGANNKIWWHFSPTADLDRYSVVPTISISGNTLSWSYSSTANTPPVGGILRYGRY